jgi:predicted methyltransferase
MSRQRTGRQLDAGRHPGELLAFLGLRLGMRVAELAAGAGYTTELLARAVGPTGKVWAQNNAMFLKFIDKPWAERLARPAMKSVVRSERIGRANAFRGQASAMRPDASCGEST